MIEYLGYFVAFLIGLVLGLIGGGGSILTVPVLVYLLGINPVVATAYSLFIVGTTSAFGTLLNYKKGLVEIKTGLKFAVPSLLAIYFTRKYLIHFLPENLLILGKFTITKDFFLMVLFAIVMILASLSMIYGKTDRKEKNTNPNLYITFLQMLFVGIIIGLIGAGGGFLFIPALIYIEKLPIKKAVGTSVFIIAINSLIGFSGDVCNMQPDWYFLILFTLISILGIFVGIYINKFINEKSLKKGFGWFVLFMSVFILAKEILFNYYILTMKIEQIYTGCIAQAAYYLESNGEVAIFDPLREVQPYLDRATKDSAKIKYIFETHFHADFVSGHLDLAKKSGGKIVYGPTANPKFEAIIANDGQDFKVGNYTIKAIHTPGHTMESTCYLLLDENQKPHGIITGDTLFIGDVGRPDLAQALSGDLTQEKLASLLFDSLRNKIMTLPDDLTVYPSHGAGSACGKNMSKETTDLLGNQKKTNYALRADMTREEFISELLNGLGAPPAYFPQNVMMNIEGYESLDAIIEKSSKPLNPEEFKAIANQSEALILDVRHENDFVKSHIPGSIFIGIQGNFAPWVGALIRDVKQPLLLITPEGREEETITRLSRVGFDNALGYLNGGIQAWENSGFETDAIESISPEEFATRVSESSIIVDARKPGEYNPQHLENALNIPLDDVNERFSEVPKEEKFFLHCAGGYRSVIMASILKSRGYHNVINVEKGMSGIRNTDLKLCSVECSSAN